MFPESSGVLLFFLPALNAPERGPRCPGAIHLHLQFRRKVLDLLKSGRTVDVGLDVTEQTIYSWRNQALI